MDIATSALVPPEDPTQPDRLPLLRLHLLPRRPRVANELSQSFRADLVRILNAGIHLECTGAALVGRLAEFLAGNFTSFETVYGSAALLQFHNVVRCIFLWMKTSDFPFPSHPAHANGRFTIFFLMYCAPEFRCLAVSKMLLSFLQEAKRRSPSQPFEVVSVAFSFLDNNLTMGALVLDEGFSAIYDRVVLNARNPEPPSSDGLRMARVLDVEIPVSFVPPSGDGLDSSVFQKVFLFCRPLYEM
ncbi:hypothetical protein FA13DRAFT_1804760 [Coprinellus micaceus]|uniref:Uncharacterized protein n=1 Tax=Coprinellus micaceus TaxID=71717 RepID=A0A4Y7S4C0_COPMI|nr:hypothetical protein FA13DRAFT_1804760 [Coprinellus micaceus]